MTTAPMYHCTIAPLHTHMCGVVSKCRSVHGTTLTVKHTCARKTCGQASAMVQNACMMLHGAALYMCTGHGAQAQRTS